MNTHDAYRMLLLACCTCLAACQDFELIRLRDQGPSPSEDHCLACMDLGQAWALVRMGEYDQVDGQCALVIEAAIDPVGVHASRAHDLANLSKGFVSIRRGDWPTARTFFDRIRDPQLRDLGRPYIASVPPPLAVEHDEVTPNSSKTTARSGSLGSPAAMSTARAQ